MLTYSKGGLALLCLSFTFPKQAPCLNDQFMKNSFCIVLYIRSLNGLETFGRFSIGTDREVAYTLFNTLKGRRDVDESQVLSMGLIEMRDELPLNVKIIGCTLNELTENCRIITREVFKLFNLKE